MRIYATINERTVRRTFREQNFGRTGLTVIDKDLPPFALKVTRKGAKTFIVRVVHKLGRDIIVLGNVHEITAEQAREKAVAAIAAAKTERETGPLFADFVKEFMRRYKMTPRERFLSLDELKRLGFVLEHAEDKQAAAAIRLLLFTGARSSEITGLRWAWIRGTRAVLPDSKTGPKTIQLPPPARAVLNGLPHTGPFVFPGKAAGRISGIVNEAMTGTGKEGGR